MPERIHDKSTESTAHDYKKDMIECTKCQIKLASNANDKALKGTPSSFSEAFPRFIHWHKRWLRHTVNLQGLNSHYSLTNFSYPNC